ncbi:MAG: molecular chaperone TorD family protein [Aggregatilineales bacterium]
MSQTITLRPSLDELLAYGLAYKYLGETFYTPPQSDLLEVLIGERLFELWPLPANHRCTQTGLEVLNTFTAQAEPETAIHLLRRDYQALFIGPGHVKAPPWESVYRSREHIMFERQTLEVRAFYAAFGLQAPKLNVEPDDHFGLELQFLAYLFSSGAEALSSQQLDQAAHALRGAQAFLQRHVLPWADEFLGRVAHHALSEYYRGVAYLAAGTLQSTCRALALQWEPVLCQ